MRRAILFGRLLACLVTGAVVVPGTSHAADALSAFDTMVEVCDRPGLAPDQWLGPARAAGWAEPDEGQLRDVLLSLASARLLGGMASTGFAPPRKGDLAKLVELEQDVLDARLRVGLNEIYIHQGNPDRVARLSPPEAHLRGVLLTEPVGALCSVTFFGESAAADDLPTEALSVPIGETAIVHLAVDSDPYASGTMLYVPHGDGVIPTAIRMTTFTAPGLSDPVCVLKIQGAFGQSGDAPFVLPACARRME